MAKLIPIIIGAVLIENYVLVRFMGMCPFLGVSKNTKTAFGMGCAVIFTITISSAVTYAVNRFILVPLDMQYLKTIAFILVIAAMVQLVELALAKFIPRPAVERLLLACVAVGFFHYGATKETNARNSPS